MYALVRTIVLSSSATALVLAMVIGTHLVQAQSMQSINYRIQSDSINVGGGYSSSTNYQLEDTAGEIATGRSSSESYVLKAGYQQMQEMYLALSGVTDVVMSPLLGGVSGGTANGSTTVTATTDNAAGYTLSVTASTSPALQSGLDTIADYTPIGAAPDFAFTNDASESQFGFSPEGTDIVDRFRDNGTACDAGSGDTAGACWDGLATTPTIISDRTVSNHPNGTDTTIRFRVQIGSSRVQTAGIYTATTTITLLPL